MPWELTQVVVGLRHQKIWKIRDDFGGLIDTLLRLQGTASVPNDAFPKVTMTEHQFSYALHDEEETIKVDLALNGVVLFLGASRFRDDPLETARSMFTQIAERILRHTHAEKEIDRLGIIHNYRSSTGDSIASCCVPSCMHDVALVPESTAFTTKLRLPDPSMFGVWERRCIIMGSYESGLPKENGSVSTLAIDYQHYFQPRATLATAGLAKLIDASRDLCRKLLSTDYALCETKMA